MTRSKPRTARGTSRGQRPREDTTMPDPADRLRIIREHMAAERTKLPAVDHNGHPITPALPADPQPAPEPAGPRNPVPDPSQGAGRAAVTPEGGAPVPPGLANRAAIAAARANHRPAA